MDDLDVFILLSNVRLFVPEFKLVVVNSNAYATIHERIKYCNRKSFSH